MRLHAGILLLCMACAKVVSPSGGPVDNISPELLEVLPSPGFVEETPAIISLLFSEKIRATEQDVQVYPGTDAEIELKGDLLIIKPGESDGLLIVTLSTSIEDIRGNLINKSETLVWNTIPADSFAEVSVSVLRTGGGEVTSSARCDFFLLPDTTSPRATHYPDSLGFIKASWLSPGDYRVVCYEDVDLSRIWDPEREPGAAGEISLLSGSTEQITLSMTIVDSIGPRVSEIAVLDGWHLEITWNEQVNVKEYPEDAVLLTGPDSLPLTVYGIKNSAGRSSNGRLTAYTEQLSDTLYSIVIQGIEDLAGNPSLPDTLEFWGSDSLPSVDYAVQSGFPADGAVEVPPAGPFFISFSDWTDFTALDSLYSVVRVADSIEVQGELVRTSPIAFSFYPATELLGQRQYRVDLSGGLISLQGDTISGGSWTFTPAWSDLPGRISGTISGTSSSVVTMVVAPAGSGSETGTADFAPGSYIFEEVSGGRYTVSVFVDWNSDKIWNPGEPYGAWPGVVEVFPGIETDNINIQVVP